MHFLILGIGLCLGLYGLYRFMTTANTRQIIAFFVIVTGIAIFIGIFFMTITGRLLPAVGLLVAIWPILFSLYIHHKKKETEEFLSQKRTFSPNKNKSDMDREEAYEILGLDKDASTEDIEKAYKKLMKKVHPDVDGSEWLASKLNEAKELLLADKE